MAVTTISCPSDSRFRIVMDDSEIFPHDPGQGTPLMVYGPKNSSSTFTCALCEGELDGYGELPPSILRWLDDVSDRAYEWLDSHS